MRASIRKLLTPFPLSSRLSAIEARIEKTAQHIHGGLPSTSHGGNPTAGSVLNSMSSSDDSDAEDDAIIPSAKFLRDQKTSNRL